MKWFLGNQENRKGQVEKAQSTIEKGKKNTVTLRKGVHQKKEALCKNRKNIEWPPGSGTLIATGQMNQETNA